MPVAMTRDRRHINYYIEKLNNKMSNLKRIKIKHQITHFIFLIILYAIPFKLSFSDIEISTFH